MYILFSFIILTVFVNENIADDPIITLPKGKIRGSILQSQNGIPYYGFQKIPYAAPPIGANRLQLPKDPEPWSGILNTTESSVSCMQQNANCSENCLFLNVFTPLAPGSSQRLPVMVWIHGGGFTSGTGSSFFFGPKYFMDHGIIVVTFNYRLGNLGFLATGDDVIPGNLGLKDQLFALEWINRNIELFGGNSSHVTLVGESAGSLSVGYHLLGPWPNGKALFHAAILQSGSPMYYGRKNYAREAAFQLANELNSSFTSDDTRELLRILQAATSEQFFLGTFMPQIPQLEKSGPFSYQMLETMQKGNFKKVPIIIGTTSEEWLGVAMSENITESSAYLDNDISQMLDGWFNLSTINRTTAVHLLKSVYTNTTFSENPAGFIRYRSDRLIHTPTTKQAELHSKFADVYMYQFSYKGVLGFAPVPYIPGIGNVEHAEDIFYFWHFKTEPDLSKFPEDDMLTSQRAVKLWTNFIKYHNPTPVKDPLLQNITWTKIDPKQPGNLQYLNLNKTLEMRSNPRNYQQIRKIMDYYISPEIIV